MKITIIVAVLASIVLGGLLYLKLKRQSSDKPLQTTYNKVDANNFVKRLDEFGYFKYADLADLDSLKKNMIDSYDHNNELTSIWDDKTGTPKDYRYYFWDGETVYEQGGIIGLLKDIKPTLDKLNFKCDISNHFEEWDDKNKWLNHRLTINGTEYIIFKNFKKTGWGEAPLRIAEILNIELAKQNKDERIYLASGGNDGRLIFLTKELYDHIYSVYKNPMWKPLALNEWAKAMQVNPMKLDWWTKTCR